MMQRRMTSSRLAMVVATLAAASCGREATQIVLVVDTEFRVPDEMDNVVVTARGPTAMMNATVQLAGGGAVRRPLTLSLVPQNNMVGTVDVTVVGRLGTDTIVTRRAIAAFVQGESRMLRIVLQRSCRGMACATPADQTCIDGRCMSATVTNLPRWTGTPPGTDGGTTSDACVPSMERCNGLDDDCDGVVDNGFNTATDPMNCGRCGLACDFQNGTGICTAGACTLMACRMGFDDCDRNPANGCEADLTAATSCGSCMRACSFAHAAATCTAGACRQGACMAGFGDCNMMPSDGCETDLATTVAHCSACGNACAPARANPSCVAGACQVASCQAGFGNCNMLPGDGCETALNTVSNCGMCRTACSFPNATPLCTAGACMLGACNRGFGNCDGNAANGCETDLTSMTTNCGFCAHRCSGGATCNMGVCTNEGVVDLGTGGSHTCVARITGAIACGGLNSNGQLGDLTTTSPRLTLAPAGFSIGAVEIVGGLSHTCARRATGSVDCWGLNDFGQLGDGTMTTRLAAVPATLVGGAPLSGVTQVAAGGSHSCALLGGTRTVNCWGENTSGQLGNNTTATQTRAVAVLSITDAAGVAAGSQHTCVVRMGGVVSCFGLNNFGQLGDGTVTERHLPAAVSGLFNAVQTATGQNHSCARRMDGTVVCWGQGSAGQLGDGTMMDRRAPVVVTGLMDAIDIAAGANHSCALRRTGEVVCWGQNSVGQLGDGTLSNRSLPGTVAVGVTDAQQIALGNAHSCARTALSTVMCWGANMSGQLGDGTSVMRMVPTRVTGLP